jgi:hypothetical protein
MKKVFFFSVLLSFFAVASYAQTYASFSITLDYAIDQVDQNISGGTYNFVTDHYLICEYSAGAVSILNGSDGSDTSTDLNLTGLTLGSLNVFCISAADDGAIFGGSNEVNTGDPFNFIRWPDEASAGADDLATGIQFPRTMAAQGSGVDTFVAVAGQDDNGFVQVLTTTDGVTFAITETTPDTSDNPALGIKHGVCIADDMSAIFGGEGYGGSYPGKLINAGGGTWVRDATFDPSDQTIAAPCPMDYDENWNLLFCVDSPATGSPEDFLHALNGTTGDVVDSVTLGLDVGNYGYGRVDLDEANQVGYVVARNGTSDGAILAKFTYPEFVPPLAADQSIWALYD